MPLAKVSERDRKMAANALSPCRCSIEYTSRSLVAPDCALHQDGEAVATAIAAARAAGYAAGIADAAKALDDEARAVEMTGRGTHAEATSRHSALVMRNCAAAICALAERGEQG